MTSDVGLRRGGGFAEPEAGGTVSGSAFAEASARHFLHPMQKMEPMVGIEPTTYGLRILNAMTHTFATLHNVADQ